MRFATRLVPITRRYEGDKFFTVVNGRSRPAPYVVEAGDGIARVHDKRAAAGVGDGAGGGQ